MLIDADTPYFRFTRENRVKFKMYINVNTRKYQIQNFVTVGGALPRTPLSVSVMLFKILRMQANDRFYLTNEYFVSGYLQN